MHTAMLVPSRAADTIGGAQTSTAGHLERASRCEVQRPREGPESSAAAAPHRTPDAPRFTLRDHRTFRAPYMELTAPLFDLGHWSVYMALKTVSPPHSDHTTRTFVDSGP